MSAQTTDTEREAQQAVSGAVAWVKKNPITTSVVALVVVTVVVLVVLAALGTFDTVTPSLEGVFVNNNNIASKASVSTLAASPGDVIPLQHSGNQTKISWRFSRDGVNFADVEGLQNVPPGEVRYFTVPSDLYSAVAKLQAYDPASLDTSGATLEYKTQWKVSLFVVPTLAWTGSMTEASPELTTRDANTLTWSCKLSTVTHEAMALDYRLSSTSSWIAVANSALAWNVRSVTWTLPNTLSPTLYVRLRTTNLAGLYPGANELEATKQVRTSTGVDLAGGSNNTDLGYFGVMNIYARSNTSIYDNFVPGQEVTINLNLSSNAPATLPQLEWAYAYTSALSPGDASYVSTTVATIDRYHYYWNVPVPPVVGENQTLRVRVRTADGLSTQFNAVTVLYNLKLTTTPSINTNENVLRVAFALGDPYSYTLTSMWTVTGTIISATVGVAQVAVSVHPTAVAYLNGSYLLSFDGKSYGYAEFYRLSNYRFTLNTGTVTMYSSTMVGAAGGSW